jgi:hypothetical protein
MFGPSVGTVDFARWAIIQKIIDFQYVCEIPCHCDHSHSRLISGSGGIVSIFPTSSQVGLWLSLMAGGILGIW